MANRILHATDFSAASGPAFRQAIAMARRDRAELLVLHVLSPPAPMVADAYITPNVWNTLLRSQRASAQRRLDTLVDKARRARVPTPFPCQASSTTSAISAMSSPPGS